MSGFCGVVYFCGVVIISYMKNKLFIVSVLVSVIFAVSYITVYARDGENGDNNSETRVTEPSEAPERSNAPEPSETPEQSETPEPSETPELGEPANNSAEQQKHAADKIAKAQRATDRLSNAVSAFGGTILETVQRAVDLSAQKLADAKAALASGQFGKASGQAEAAKSIAEHGLEMLNNEHEADSIEHDLNHEIDDEDISDIELDPASNSTGFLRIKHSDNSHTEKRVPESGTSLFNVKTDSGDIGAHIASGSKIVLDNEDIDIESDFPVSVDVKNKKVFVKVASGSEELKVLPSEALKRVENRDKPDIVKTATLKQEGNLVIFEIVGTRVAKLFGIIPVTVDLTTTLDSQNGTVVSVNNPWFIRAFGLFFL